jgi:U4/U6.U5 tri-snRNP-associated protein 3
MMRAMGLPLAFDTTQGRHVPGTDVSAAKVIKKRRYRQYMNRPGGFNRPLDPS